MALRVHETEHCALSGQSVNSAWGQSGGIGSLIGGEDSVKLSWHGLIFHVVTETTAPDTDDFLQLNWYWPLNASNMESSDGN